MTRRHCGLGFLLLLSCVFIFALFTYYPVESQDSGVKAARVDFLRGNKRRMGTGQELTSGGRAVDGVPAPYPNNVYFPITIKNEPVLRGHLEKEELIISSLASNTVDRWRMELTAGDMVTLTVTPGTSASIILTVLDPYGNRLVDEQNLSPAGEVETIKDLTIVGTGKYDLLIHSEQGQKSDYAVMLSDQESNNFVFRGRLIDSQPRSDSLPADTDHFWFIHAHSGGRVTFIVSPDSGSDAYVELYGPSGTRIMTIDDHGVGVQESVENLDIVDGGRYGIRVGEFDSGPMDYQIIYVRLTFRPDDSLSIR
jgi:hypothetical protein